MVEIGKKYNHLTCLRKDSSRDYRYYIFKCDCGNVKSIIAYNVERGTTTSCGCYARKKRERGELHRKHGGHGTRLYRIWKSMRERCNTKTMSNYAIYGGRGIRVCDEWQNYPSFKEWALSNGYSDNLSIDRIDVNGNYEPSNCRWVTRKVQANNTRTNRRITINGNTHTIAEWAEISGISYKTIHRRLTYMGWDAQRAVFAPPRKKGA